MWLSISIFPFSFSYIHSSIYFLVLLVYPLSVKLYSPLSLLYLCLPYLSVILCDNYEVQYLYFPFSFSYVHAFVFCFLVLVLSPFSINLSYLLSLFLCLS